MSLHAAGVTFFVMASCIFDQPGLLGTRLIRSLVRNSSRLQIGSVSRFKSAAFSDRNVLGLNLAALLKLDIPDNTKLGFRLPTYAIETDYGYWVPKEYVDFVEQRLEKASGPKRRALEKRGVELQQIGGKYVDKQIKVYLDEVERMIATGGKPLALTKQEKEAIEEKIVRRVAHLKTLLTDRKALERLAQTLVGAPVPEFWEDEASVCRFVEGFCYDIVAKLNAPKNTPKIVAHLADQFDIREADDVTACREKIERFFSQASRGLRTIGHPCLTYVRPSDPEPPLLSRFAT